MPGSVALATSSKTDVIVVDNASSDGSVEMLESYRVRPIRLIKNKENLGGTGGFNTGLREALSGVQYVHLLDNDVIVDENTFRNSYDLLENEPSIEPLVPNCISLMPLKVARDGSKSIGPATK